MSFEIYALFVWPAIVAAVLALLGYSVIRSNRRHSGDAERDSKHSLK